jgi:hypothetical protein
VEVIKPSQTGLPMIVITWPNHKTEVSPAKLSQAVADASRILANSLVELIRRRVKQLCSRSGFALLWR